MFDLTNASIDILILLLRIAVVLLLYFFLWQVLRFVIRDLRAGGEPPSGRQSKLDPQPPSMFVVPSVTPVECRSV